MEANFERIQRYFEEDMSQQERLSFEKELSTNSQLQQEVEEYHLIVSSIQKAGMKDVLNQVDLPSLEETKVKANPTWLVVSILLFVSLALLFLLKNQLNKEHKTTNPPEEEVIQYADQMPALEGLPVTLSDAATEFTDAMIAYRRQDYAKAVTLFEELMRQAIISDTLTIYYSNALIETGALEEAINQLEPLSRNQQSSYFPASQWYLAKAYFLKDDPNRAINYLESIVQNESEYTAQARALLQK